MTPLDLARVPLADLPVAAFGRVHGVSTKRGGVRIRVRRAPKTTTKSDRRKP